MTLHRWHACDEIRISLCPLVELLLTVQDKTNLQKSNQIEIKCTIIGHQALETVLLDEAVSLSDVCSNSSFLHRQNVAAIARLCVENVKFTQDNNLTETIMFYLNCIPN